MTVSAHLDQPEALRRDETLERRFGVSIEMRKTEEVGVTEDGGIVLHVEVVRCVRRPNDQHAIRPKDTPDFRE